MDSAPIECCSFSEGRKEIERKERRKEATEETKKGKKKGKKEKWRIQHKDNPATEF